MTFTRSKKLLLAALSATLAVGFLSMPGTALAQPDRACAKDVRDGILINSGGPKCLRVLKVYNRAVIEDGHFRPYGSYCVFNVRRKHWRCRAGKYRTMSIEQFEFSRGWVDRHGDRFRAHVKYPAVWTPR